MRGSRVGGLFGVAAVLAWPAHAPEAIRVAVSPAGELAVVGTRGDDQVRIERAGDVYRLTAEMRSVLRAGAGCRQAAGKVAECPVAAVTRIAVSTGDGLDHMGVYGIEPVTVPLTISTGRGADSVDLEWAAVGPAVVDAGAGDDYVIGGRGPDRLDGGDGDDVLYGGSSADTLLGGPGDDLLDDMLPESPPTSDTLDCGPGVDEPRADGTDVVLACEQPPSEWKLWPASSVAKYRYRRFDDGTTMFTRIRITSTRQGSDVVFECRGRGCPAPTWRARQISPYSLDGLGPLRDRHLRPQARVTVTISNPVSMTKVVRWTVRRGRAPALAVHCVGPISGIVTRAQCRAAGLPIPGQ